MNVRGVDIANLIRQRRRRRLNNRSTVAFLMRDSRLWRRVFDVCLSGKIGRRDGKVSMMREIPPAAIHRCIMSADLTRRNVTVCYTKCPQEWTRCVLSAKITHMRSDSAVICRLFGDLIYLGRVCYICSIYAIMIAKRKI